VWGSQWWLRKVPSSGAQYHAVRFLPAPRTFLAWLILWHWRCGWHCTISQKLELFRIRKSVQILKIGIASRHCTAPHWVPGNFWSKMDPFGWTSFLLSWFGSVKHLSVLYYENLTERGHYGSLEKIQHHMSHVLKAMSDEACQTYLRKACCRATKATTQRWQWQWTGGLRLGLPSHTSHTMWQWNGGLRLGLPSHTSHTMWQWNGGLRLGLSSHTYPYVVGNLCLHFRSVGCVAVEQENVPKVRKHLRPSQWVSQVAVKNSVVLSSLLIQVLTYSVTVNTTQHAHVTNQLDDPRSFLLCHLFP
jgi:hypothetical protein